MMTVGVDRAAVETALIGGELGCPVLGCAGRLAPWGWARGRIVRGESGAVGLRPRRARCRACRGTHVLLPASVLLRRADEITVLGTALLAKAGGAGTGGSRPGWVCRRRRCGAGCVGSVWALIRYWPHSACSALNWAGSSWRRHRPGGRSPQRWSWSGRWRAWSRAGWVVRVCRGGWRRCSAVAGCCPRTVPILCEVRRWAATPVGSGQPGGEPVRCPRSARGGAGPDTWRSQH